MANILQRNLLRLNSNLLQHCKQFLIGSRTIVGKQRYQKTSQPETRSRADETDDVYDKPEKLIREPVRRKRRKFSLYDDQPVKLAPKIDKRPKQKFDYFLVLDFEATCDSPGNLDPQEIIEFPVLKVNSDTFQVESTFHSYVRPELNPILTPFCTELTGVIQSMVDDQPLFKEVFEKFQEWLEAENITKPDVKFAFATCGDPDLDYLLPVQCYVSGIEVPDYMKEWINVKRSICEISPYTWPDNLVAMLKMCGLQHSGDLHSGIDDAMNVVKVMADLADRGLVFNLNGWKKQRENCN